jgi:hypothetical protein
MVAMMVHSVLSLRILFPKARGPGASYMIPVHFTTIVRSGLLIPASYIVLIIGVCFIDLSGTYPPKGRFHKRQE